MTLCPAIDKTVSGYTPVRISWPGSNAEVNKIIKK